MRFRRPPGGASVPQSNRVSVVVVVADFKVSDKI